MSDTPEFDADYRRCAVCGEDTHGQSAVEMLVWNVFHPGAGGMRYEPSEEPYTYENWQDICGRVVHASCLVAFIDGSIVEAEFHRNHP